MARKRSPKKLKNFLLPKCNFKASISSLCREWDKLGSSGVLFRFNSFNPAIIFCGSQTKMYHMENEMWDFLFFFFFNKNQYTQKQSHPVLFTKTNTKYLPFQVCFHGFLSVVSRIQSMTMGTAIHFI